MKTIQRIIIREFRKHPKIDWSRLASMRIEKWFFKLINLEIKKCKDFIKEQRGFLKLKEMTNKEWLKGRIEECEYTLDVLKELKKEIGA